MCKISVFKNILTIKKLNKKHYAAILNQFCQSIIILYIILCIKHIVILPNIKYNFLSRQFY